MERRGDGIKGLKGEVRVPGDKSISHRALILGSIADGDTRIANFLNSADCRSTLNALKSMGVVIDISETETEITVHGRGLYGLAEPKEVIDAGNSGTTMRLLSGILAGQGFNSEITGDSSLKKRPMD